MTRPLGKRQRETLLRTIQPSYSRAVLDPETLEPPRLVRSLINEGLVTVRRVEISYWDVQRGCWAEGGDVYYDVARTPEGEKAAALEKQRRELAK